jgi:hypothetical protein
MDDLTTNLEEPSDFYTKYCIQCQMAFCVIVVTFLMTLLTNKFTNIVTLTYFLVHLLLGYSASKLFNIEILSWMIKIWMKRHLVSHSFCNNVKSIMPNDFTRIDG